ncbi:PDZ domain-containing protein [Rhodobacteraceae bacterium 2CG4]|uniref:PDZ domain-containing protein n=1 Tax=Halovulum marinum TaxID=2662447 RepID=A0A6L5Z4X2_9RHOB|nr:trypsin-like peptidase domain-containing protein [Halovulum marinum]MSU91621.1 PDZ domain-containing protein [Halovulum marinum]
MTASIFRPLVLVLTLVAGALPAQEVPQSRAEIALSFSPVAKQAIPAVVNIYATRVVQQRASPFAGDPFFERFFQPRAAPRLQNSLGSGVIVDPSGIVVSNHHVVGSATEIRVVLSDRREYDAEVLLSDEARDIAVLKVDADAPLPALELADSDRAQVGDLVLAIGNPFGVGQTVTGGIVSGLARSARPGDGTEAYFIQTDAAINPGNSGGALVDMAGRLLGLNTSILTRSGGSNGIGFAIPSNLVRAYVERAGEDPSPWPWTGVSAQAVDAELAQALGMDRPRGVLLSEVHPASALTAAGLAPGDVVLDIDGLAVATPGELAYRIRTRPLGASVQVRYLRGGKARTAALTVAAAPETPPRDSLRLGGSRHVLSGMMVENVNPAVIAELDLPLNATGVVVRDPGQAGRLLGLRAADVIEQINGRRIEDTEDLRAAARTVERGIDMRLTRDGRRHAIRFR